MNLNLKRFLGGLSQEERTAAQAIIAEADEQSVPVTGDEHTAHVTGEAGAVATTAPSPLPEDAVIDADACTRVAELEAEVEALRAQLTEQAGTLPDPIEAAMQAGADEAQGMLSAGAILPAAVPMVSEMLGKLHCLEAGESVSDLQVSDEDGNPISLSDAVAKVLQGRREQVPVIPEGSVAQATPQSPIAGQHAFSDEKIAEIVDAANPRKTRKTGGK